MFQHRLGVILLGDLERLRIDEGRLLPTGIVEHDGFKSLRAHDRSESAAGSDTGGNPVLIQVLDAGRFHAHLAAGTDHGDGNLVAIFREQLRGSFIHTDPQALP